MGVRAEVGSFVFAAFVDWKGVRRRFIYIGKPARLASIEALSIFTVFRVGSIQKC
jgi:hypothetical protein